MANGRPKKRKKVRYSEIRIRLSYKQKRSLLNYCHARKTTPNKLIKKMIRKYISNFAEDVPEEYYATENQLDLFPDIGEEEFSVEFVDEADMDEETLPSESQVSSVEYQVSGIESQVSGIESQSDKEVSEDQSEEEEDKPLTLF